MASAALAVRYTTDPALDPVIEEVASEQDAVFRIKQLATERFIPAELVALEVPVHPEILWAARREAVELIVADFLDSADMHEDTALARLTRVAEGTLADHLSNDKTGPQHCTRSFWLDRACRALEDIHAVRHGRRPGDETAVFGHCIAVLTGMRAHTSPVGPECDRCFTVTPNFISAAVASARAAHHTTKQGEAA